MSDEYEKTARLVSRLTHSRSEPTMAYTPDGTIVYANRSYDQLFAATHPEGTLGVNFTTLEEGKEEILQEMLEVNLARTPNDPELIIESPTIDSYGEPRWFQWKCIQGFDDDENITIIVCLAREITYQKIAEVRSERAAERLEESNRDLLEFAQVASHDLQEPLRKVTAFANRLESHLAEDLDEKGADYMRRMVGAVDRMQGLIDDLLTYARVTTRGTDMVPTSVRPIVEAVLEDLEIAIEESGATIDVGRMPKVPVDPSQIGQLFQNLIGNALKFRREGVPPEITIHATHVKATKFGGEQPKKGWYDIAVSDNGIGFDEQYANKIFAPFQRLHGRNEYEGSGVGLSVCRRIAERHQGAISASSVPGEGTTFTIRLPTEQLDIVPTTDLFSATLDHDALHHSHTRIYGAEEAEEIFAPDEDDAEFSDSAAA